MARQGIDLREGLTSGPLLEQVRQALREQAAYYMQDCSFTPDIERATELLAQGTSLQSLPEFLQKIA